jgi:hypothetical protein
MEISDQTAENLFIPASREKGVPFSVFFPTLKNRPNDFQRHLSWKQIAEVKAQHSCQKEQFAIRNPAQPQFQLGQRMPADRPTQQLQLARHGFLRPAPVVTPFAHLGANQIQSDLHQERRIMISEGVTCFPHEHNSQKRLDFFPDSR